MGWIGSESELLNVLSVFKCDRDEEGKFKVDGNITSFLGLGEEFVVGDDAVAYVNDKPCNLCNMLEATSYGLKVRVI